MSPIQSMPTRPSPATRLPFVVLAALATALAGCGGGDGDDAPPPSTGSSVSLMDFYSCIASALFLGPGCPISGGSGSSSGGSGTTSIAGCVDFYCGSPPDFSYPDDFFGGPTTIPGSIDIEPNDELATASVAVLGFFDGEIGPIGFQTDGSVHALNDSIDTYIFTSPLALDVVVQLCETRGATCDGMTAESSLDVAFATIALLDQDGNGLATTVNETVNGNLISLPIAGGVPYYVSVVTSYRSIELLPSDQRYYLRLIGTPPLIEAGTEPDPAEPGFVRPQAPQLTLSGSGSMIATLDWIAPSLNTDGTALVDLNGYVLYYGGAQGGAYTYRLPIDLGLSSYTLSLPDCGEWYFVLAAVNAADLASAFSNEVASFDPPPTFHIIPLGDENVRCAD
jgi:hypothetical protein